ncbi:transcription factor Adf-1-like [Thrips palmi]|uniref:Transcription factor Adf-1-like n=1 Tax=Thrips palmi TaxID=161013 RepID=A0A6P8ZLB8_THRPL|nr:transcription factor Adf-1-like [Thrips palmi]
MEVSGTSDLDLSKKLINLIKDQPFLYDKTLEEFKDEERKSEAWNVIAQSLNMTAEDVQVRWARLRVDFGRHRRKMKEAEARGNHSRSWPLYGPLMWLAPHIKMRAKRGQRKQDVRSKAQPSGYNSNLSHADWLLNSNGSVQVEVSPSIVMHEDHEDITESFIVSPDTADYEDDASLEDSHVYERQHGKDIAYSNSYATDSHSGPSLSLEEETEDILFCRSVCASLKRFSHQQKALAKIRIQQVMYDVEFAQPEGNRLLQAK